MNKNPRRAGHRGGARTIREHRRLPLSTCGGRLREAWFTAGFCAFCRAAVGSLWGARYDGSSTRESDMLKEFRDFAMRGNVVDLAVGVIIGAAFGKIVESLVGDLFMPVLGAATGGLDFSNYFTPLSAKVTAVSLEEAKKQGAVLAWGNFLTIALNFAIVAAALFLVIKGMNYLKKKDEEKKADTPPKQEVLLTEIRDLLKDKR
jgi:large conductance mechanosensitive channel